MAAEWSEDVYSLLDTAIKLVKQSHQILVREELSQAWTEELQDAYWQLQDYLSEFKMAWIEDM